MNLKLLRLCKLKPHPLNSRIYGAAEPDQVLIQSIEAVGVLNAIIIDQKGRILSGTRRWKACKILAERHRTGRFNQIPIEVFKGSDLEAQRRLIHANRQREKTIEQKAREYREALRLETELARQRMIATLRKGSATPAREKVPEWGRAADIAAKATGLSFKTLNKFLKVIEEADRGNVEARAKVDEVNRNECGPTTAYLRIFAKIQSPPTVPVESRKHVEPPKPLAWEAAIAYSTFDEDLNLLDIRIRKIEYRVKMTTSLGTERLKVASRLLDSARRLADLAQKLRTQKVGTAA